MIRRASLLFVSLAAAGSAVAAQGQPAAKPRPGATPPAAAAPAQPEASQAPAYSYQRDGRRDPFISLVGRGEGVGGTSRPAGIAGMLINEVSLKGIVRLSTGYVATLEGPDKKPYIVRVGQRLFDGTVKSITHDTVVFSQDVNDPLSLVKQREVRKTLRTSEENRG